ncbi:MAG: hypothetical protein J2P20_20280 [Pseudonocardia sp.]|nr:hypothetical protein [Pseudonocardia sp.]MBO0871799.1 hypothetical protein [Pseudonocardia sp.]
MWIALSVGVLCLLVLVALVVRLRVGRPAASRADDTAFEDDIPVGWARRRAQELHVETLLPPSDPRVAELAGYLRDRYNLGDTLWEELAPGVLGELERRGEVGVKTACFIVTSALADFRWELDFLENWNGVPTEQRTGTPMRIRLLRVVTNTPASPFSTPSGFHPLIHLVAALRLLTARPVPDLARPLEELLEFWFAYAESKPSLEPHDVKLLEALVDCYRSTTQNLASHRDVPDFLTELVERQVASPVGHASVSDALAQQQARAGTYSLSSLAARARG